MMMKSRNIFEFGDQRYVLHANWAHLPQHLRNMIIADVVYTPDGYLYALTRNHEHPILVFDQNGEYVESIGADLNFGNEHGLSLSSDNCLWVCDSGRHVVYKLTRKGEVVMRMGTMDVPCDNGFNPEMPYPYNLFSIKCAGAPFNKPTGAMEAPDGTIWCTDGYGNTSLHHFSKEGTLLKTVGGPGIEHGKFRLPHSLWIDGEGRVWVADRDNHRVQLFDSEGELVKCFDPVYPDGIPYGPSAMWGDDRYIYCCQSSRGIIVYDVRTLEYVGMIEAHAGSPILGHSICGDAAGNLYIGHLETEPMISKLEKI